MKRLALICGHHCGSLDYVEKSLGPNDVRVIMGYASNKRRACGASVKF